MPTTEADRLPDADGVNKVTPPTAHMQMPNSGIEINGNRQLACPCTAFRSLAQEIFTKADAPRAPEVTGDGTLTPD